MAVTQEDLNMNKSIQTSQNQIEQHATEGAAHHAKPFLAATDAQKASQASRLARWLPTPGNVIFTLLAIGLLIMTQNVWSAPSLANTPGPSATTVNYQGRLADSSGNPLSGSYNLQFAIYDAPTGGNRVWAPESHLGVSVTDGLFSVDLGSQTTGGIPTSTWDGDRYLEITINGEPLTPRELIRSVPIAGMALTVPDGAITTEKIADGAVGSSDVAANSLTADDLAANSVTSSEIADNAVTLKKMGLAKYDFWHGSQHFIHYRGPTGQETTLDPASCSSEALCCNADNSICYYPRSSADSILEFSLDGAPSIGCVLVHNDDDVLHASKGLYYATDGGNSCYINDSGCARLSKNGVSGNPINFAAQYAWLCGW